MFAKKTLSFVLASMLVSASALAAPKKKPTITCKDGVATIKTTNNPISAEKAAILAYDCLRTDNQDLMSEEELGYKIALDGQAPASAQVSWNDPIAINVSSYASAKPDLKGNSSGDYTLLVSRGIEQTDRGTGLFHGVVYTLWFGVTVQDYSKFSPSGGVKQVLTVKFTGLVEAPKMPEAEEPGVG